MQRSHKIRLYPNNRQATYFAKACGCARLAYNWGLAEWQRRYSQGERPSAYGLKKQFNALKREQFPFVSEVTKWAPERSFFDLDRAFKNFFRNKRFRYPKFKKKGQRDSFYISGSVVKLDQNRVCIPKLGWVRMAECLRFSGKLQSVTISKRADRWFASIAVDIPDAEYSESQAYSAVGIDLGVKRLATLSNGTVFENPATTQKFAKRLRRANKALARKQKGSSNFKKQKRRLARLHQKIADYRSDAVHKFTSFVADRYSDVCVEDLNVAGMVRNRRLAKAISDASFREIRRQLEYKSIRLHVVDRWLPSTKLCASCGQLRDMPLSERVFKCDCGFGPIDRDLNAAQNILRQGLPWQPVERPALALSLAVA
jgi:putative transposase